MISDSQEIVENGMEAFTDEDGGISGIYDSADLGFDPDVYGGDGSGGGIIPTDGIPSGYELCANESMNNLTFKSLFCDFNYTHPMIPLNVSLSKKILQFLFYYFKQTYS